MKFWIIHKWKGEKSSGEVDNIKSFIVKGAYNAQQMLYDQKCRA
jgi:hypothetical protein